MPNMTKPRSPRGERTTREDNGKSAGPTDDELPLPCPPASTSRTDGGNDSESATADGEGGREKNGHAEKDGGVGIKRDGTTTDPRGRTGRGSTRDKTVVDTQGKTEKGIVAQEGAASNATGSQTTTCAVEKGNAATEEEGDTTPQKPGTIDPKNEDVNPKDEGTIPRNEGKSSQDQGSELPAEETAQPSEGSTPANEGTTPSNEGTLLQEEGGTAETEGTTHEEANPCDPPTAGE